MMSTQEDTNEAESMPDAAVKQEDLETTNEVESSMADASKQNDDQPEDDLDLQCSICLDFFFEPLTLQCCHSFCRVCLLQSTRLAPDGRSCPQCRAPIESITDPRTHPADERLAAKVAASTSADKLEERSAQSKAALEALAKLSAGALPVFISGGAGRLGPGAPVDLHFFEPRYRILIRRAWEGERRFVWADATPYPAEPLSGLLVSVEQAVFLPDGRANVTGRAVERVTLAHSWVEEDTNGLWYAGETQGSTAPLPRTPARTTAQAATRSSRSTNTLLRAAISLGAPTYNRGDVRGCAEVILLCVLCIAVSFLLHTFLLHTSTTSLTYAISPTTQIYLAAARALLSDGALEDELQAPYLLTCLLTNLLT